MARTWGWQARLYHMYVSYVRGIPSDWSGSRSIVHLISRNLWDWHYESSLRLSSERVIDAAVMRLPSGHWRMWYKDEANQSHTYAADSDDLYGWAVHGSVITDFAHWEFQPQIVMKLSHFRDRELGTIMSESAHHVATI